ncbi:MAG: electron transfer flavoprotein subunit alpha/FixB family protein [Verrucomicrobia bacterium]|nr:electron transfer flavoprotein subunit alpha/FixB family protein [Verrucomicrobiota bacterium]
MAGNIWIIAEAWRGQVSEITFELLALGREVAGQAGAPLEAVLLGSNARELAQKLGAADSVLYADNAALADPVPENFATALAQLIKEKQPAAVLVPLTNLSVDVGVVLAAQLGVPFLNYCKDLKAEGGNLTATCVLYGGKMEATVTASAKPAIIGILPGARPVEQGRSDKAATITDVAVTLAAPKVHFKRYLESEAGDVDITQKDFLVAVGRGIQTKDNLDLAEDLAATLGGAVCGSRPVIDQGWLGLSRQVGKSGMLVKPKLYVMLGISGAPEHVEGMKGSQCIIAVNTDAAAPIFNVAHYGVVGDALEVAPALTEKIKARKG